MAKPLDTCIALGALYVVPNVSMRDELKRERPDAKLVVLDQVLIDRLIRSPRRRMFYIDPACFQYPASCRLLRIFLREAERYDSIIRF